MIPTPLKPYKSIGVFSSHPYSSIQLHHNPSLGTVTGHSYKIWSLPQLKIKVIGPHLPEVVELAVVYLESVFVISGNYLYRFKYIHLIEQIDLRKYVQIKKQKQVGLPSVLVGNFLIFAYFNTLLIYDFKQNQIRTMQLNTPILKIVHPPTYMNKILVLSQDSISLINFISKASLYQYSSLFNQNIINIQASPALDITAFISQHKIYFLNLKNSQILFNIQQPNVFSLAFNQYGQEALLACSLKNGYLNLFSLKEKRKIGRVNLGQKSWISFINQKTGVGVGENGVRVWRWEQSLQVVKKRQGVKGIPEQIEFYDSITLVSCTNCGEGQLRLYSLINQTFSYTFSKPKFLQPIKRLAFCSNKSNQSDILTAVNNQFPYLWSTQTKSFVKVSIEMQQKNIHLPNQKRYFHVQEVQISKCGHFGFLGFQNGQIIKFGMKTGKYLQKLVGHSSTIKNIIATTNNHFIYSIDQSRTLILWDFYSGKLLWQQQIGGLKMKESISGDFLGISHENNDLSIWDSGRGKKGRVLKGHDGLIKDFSFSSDNKWIISIDEKSQMIIWDIILGQKRFNLKVFVEIKRISFSPDNRYVISIQENSKQIYLWHNLIQSYFSHQQHLNLHFQTPLLLDTSTDPRSFLAHHTINPLKQKHQQSQLSNLFQTISIPQQNRKSLTFTQQPFYKWISLLHYDQIKQRNRLDLQITKKVELPFFLQTNKTQEYKQKIMQDFKQQKNRELEIIRNKQKKWVSEMQNFDLQQVSPMNFFESLKRCSCSIIDYKFRQFCLNRQSNYDKIVGLLQMMVRDEQEYDLKMVYLVRFLQVHCNKQVNCLNLLGNKEVGKIGQVVQCKYRNQQFYIRYCKSISTFLLNS